MTNTSVDYRALIQDALLRIDELEIQLEVTQQQKTEPIAIIGMGCRFPGGADTPAKFWDLLRNGKDAVIEIPPGRWDVDQYYDPDPDTPGKMYTRHGGFLERVDTFDANFFAISPREAMSVDPQQRLLLEVSWEALESAALIPAFDSAAGVFIGICGSEYAPPSNDQNDLYSATGNAASLAAGRLSYTLGITGPSVSVDTSCSSSLVAIHQACQSLRNQDCELALAGGVGLILRPETMIAFCKGNMLAPDNRCKTFDAAANGFVRGEGCGIVVLKRLADAINDEDNIFAVIRGSMINQDGRSSGLTAPRGPSQQAVIRHALKNANVKPSEITYIEAHGTGTSLGDPIELDALGAVFGERSEPLQVGSVKTNFGHLEGAAGMAGLIKLVLMLQHGQIPPNLHFNTPNPYIDWENLSIEIPTKVQPWSPATNQRIAGVSSFGFSGTNAHIVLGEAPAREPVTNNIERPLHLLTLSAKSAEALMELAQRYQAFLNGTGIRLADICYTVNTGRRHFGHRLSVLASSSQEMQEQFAAYCAGEMPSGVAQKYASTSQRVSKIAFLFPGQGCQYAQMGRELYETQPIFREVLNRCDQILQPLLEKPLLSVIYPTQESDEFTDDIDQTAYTQPALFALNYALVQLWRSWGIEPDVVMGHSAGEYVAACVAGVFSLEDGLKLIAARGRLMQTLPQNGEMVSILASREEVETFTLSLPNGLLDAQKVSIAAINGPQSVVISGESEAVQTVVSELSSRGIKCRTLAVSHAFHSPLMDSILAPFAQVAKEIDYHPPQIAYVSNLSGGIAADEVTSPDYWVRHVRESVRFADGMTTLYDNNVDIFIEISPKPILLGMGQLCLPEGEGTWLPSVRPNSQWSQLLTSLGKLYVHGVNVDWHGFDQPYAQARRKVALPTYAFQRERYWLEPVLDTEKLSRVRPLLDKMIQSPLHKVALFETEFSFQNFPFLADYRLYGVMVSPAAVSLSMVLSAVEVLFDTANCLLEDVNFPAPLVIPDEGTRSVQVLLSPTLRQAQGGTAEPQTAEFQVISFLAGNIDQAHVLTHAMGRVCTQSQDIAKRFSLDDLQTRCSTEVAASTLYKTAAAQEIVFGPTFQWLEQIWRGEDEALVKLERPQEIATLEGHLLHPGLLDACLQAIGAIAPEQVSNEVALPSMVAELHLYSQVEGRVWWCYVKQGQHNRWEIALLGESGTVLVELLGVETQTVSREALQLAPTWADWLYTVNWQPRPHFGLPPEYLPTPQQFSEALIAQFNTQTADINWDQLLKRDGGLESTSLAYALSALDALGFDWQPGLRLRTDQLMTQLSVIHRHERLLERLLGMLAEEGIVQRDSTHWMVTHKPQIPSLPRITTDGTTAAQRLLARCGKKLAGVLRGVQDPLVLLFPGGDASLVTEVYQDSPTALVMSQLLQETIQTAFKELPAEQGLRILEVGAGTGSTTALMLPHLPAERTEYLFTDIERAFIVQAEEAFAEYDFIQYQLLDIEQAPIEQGFTLHQYDMVIASDVLHTTQDLSQTLAHIQQLLKPDGLLLLLEMTTRHRWVDLTFGLTESWWRFTDTAIRPDHPLLSAEQWQKQLLASGFKAVTHVPEEEPKQHGHTLILAQAGAASRGEQWLLFTDASGAAESLADSLRTQGEQPILVWPGSEYKQLNENTLHINPLLAADYQRLLQAVPAPSGVVHLWSLDAPLIESSADLESTARSSCGTTLLLTQAILQSLSSPPDLWLVTRGAQSVTKGDLVSGFSQATLWGMGRTIALEHPELNCVCLDLDAQMSPQAQGEALCTEIMAASPANHEPQVALRQNSRLVARLARYQAQPKSADLPITEDGTYLITGGLDGLGLLTAERLIQEGARHLMLMGRSQPKPEVQPKLEELRALGAEIAIVQANIAECGQVAQALAQIHTEHPLRGIIHTVSVLDDGVFLRLDWTRFQKVLAPKMLGAWNLHQLTQEMSLDFFVLFSSVAGLFGRQKQANHAAANTFLDAFAHYRSGQNLRSLSIPWGLWSSVGSAAETVRTMQTKGFGAIVPEQGIDVFAHLMSQISHSQPEPSVAVAPMKWAQFLTEGCSRKAPFFELFDFASASSAVGEQFSIRQQIEQASAKKRRNIMMKHLRTVTAKVMGWRVPEQIPADEGLMTLGLDSLMTIELRNQLARVFEMQLPATLLFDYSTLSLLADNLLSRIVESSAQAQEVPEEVLSLHEEIDTIEDAELDSLSEEEMAALLSQELAGSQTR